MNWPERARPFRICRLKIFEDMSRAGRTVPSCSSSLQLPKTSAIWLRQAMGDGISVLQLNLGQHQQRCDSCETSNTSWQRPFMIIGVRDKERGVILREALRDAFSGKSNLPSPENYSAFTLAPGHST